MNELKQWLKEKHVGQAFKPAIRKPELRHFSREDIQSVCLYKRRLPHWELEGSTYFVTFRQADLRQAGRQAGKPAPQAARQVTRQVGKPAPQSTKPFMRQAGKPAPPGALKNPVLAEIVEEAIWFGYKDRYLLDAYVIMPDHVHLLIKPLAGWNLSKILKTIKGYTAREINKVLSRKGPFWQDENFDHLIRNDRDWLDKFSYIHNNPVKAGLAENPQDYPFSSLVTLHSEGRLESLPHTASARLERQA